MKQRLLIFLVLMGSYLGFYFALPLFPTIFLNSNYNFLPHNCPLSTRSILLGLTYATYYIGAFIGGPLIGKFSDHFGRKMVLSYTFLLVGCMYLLSSIAILSSSLTLLLVIRFFTGVFDSCYCLAYTTLICMEKQTQDKLPNLEFWSSTVVNVSWIVGAFIGWNLIFDSSYPSYFLSIPFLLAMIVYFSCFILIFRYFKEVSDLKKIQKNFKYTNFFSKLMSYKNSPLLPIFISNTTLYAATFIFSTYIPQFLMKHYHFEPTTIGHVETFITCSYCIAPFTFWLYSRHFSRKMILFISAIGCGFSIFFFLTLSFTGALWIFLFFTTYFTALSSSFSTFLVADHSEIENQGEIFSVNQALFNLIEALVSFLACFLAAIWIFLPFVMAISCSFFAATLIFKKLLQARKPSVIQLL